MAKLHFRPYIPNQTVLFPQRIDENIAATDPVRIVNAVIDNLNLESFKKLYKEKMCIRDRFSCAMASSTCSKRIRILSISLVLFRSTVLRQTKVYLLALDSILVPSIYSTSRLMKPLSARTRTNWVNTLFISSSPLHGYENG